MNFDNTIRELEQERELINLAITALEKARDTRTGNAVTIRNLRVTNRKVSGTGTGKRHLTAAAKQKIADAMKARWAERKRTAVTGKRLTVVRGKKAA